MSKLLAHTGLLASRRLFPRPPCHLRRKTTDSGATLPVYSGSSESPRPSRNPPHARYATKNMEVVYPQLWIFDFNRRTWTCVEAAGGGGASGGGKSEGNNNSSAAAGPGPPAVFDHTATLAGGTHIVVIGGVMVGRALNSEVRGSMRVLFAAGRVLCVQNTLWPAGYFCVLTSSFLE